MKISPRIEIYWENPPNKKSGVIIRRIVSGEVYERRVPPHGSLSSTETAKAIGRTLRQLYNLMNDRKLKPLRKSDRLFFRLSDIKQYLAKRKPRSLKREPWLIG